MAEVPWYIRFWMRPTCETMLDGRRFVVLCVRKPVWLFSMLLFLGARGLHLWRMFRR